ncbi:MAG: helix-hairpin-helix domain-containing protein, partial [Saprospiraceae bacterium]|nr:helix-hairpin-helix domain-containing protein [Saprospiraceae bacterium]
EKPAGVANQDIRSLCINRASSEEWKQLYGIGPVLADRIVKFRSALGGFARVEQVAETYGLPPETYVSISKQLTRTTDHTRIPVNLATTEMLASHPYINLRQARSIAGYIKHHGALTSVEDLYQVHSLSPDDIDRFAEYMDFSTSEGTVTAIGN